jgi:phosphatidylserine/phosphatidylglycerophosphate/cardiolipin synthase-like enzyme
VAYREQALVTSAATAAKSAARNERQLRVEQALGAALPLLNKIEQQVGNLSPLDRQKALALEATLRDRIRGRYFDSPALLSEIAAARARGVEVQVLDDGGLDQLFDLERESLLAEVATHVATVFAGRLVLRSVADEIWKVTVTASRPGYDAPDLFIRL